MSDAYVVAVDGLSAMRTLEDIPESVMRIAAMAVNKTTERTRTSSAKAMREQVNFPARYLSGKDGQLSITQYANQQLAEARITGRFRPTSLARFARGTPETTRRAGGVRVQVAPGAARFMRRAFLIRLRGATDVESGSNLTNIGLAIRLRADETPQNKKKMVQMKNGLWLLYGPSVDQVFRTVADDEAPGAAEYLEQEFLRLMELGR